MEFRIADTFTASLARLTAYEQRAAKATAFDLQLNPANRGIHLHRIERSKDRNFWSARTSRGLRLVVHRTALSLLLCYADHHDDAYRWAERRVIEWHPRTVPCSSSRFERPSGRLRCSATSRRRGRC